MDAVPVFEEDTSCAAVEPLRPEVWVKDGDHGGRVPPETVVPDRLEIETSEVVDAALGPLKVRA
ncbi:hypothetical protein ACLQ2R_19415 [Streptosporangium sp. DT93]|uniref:hypothetical protein n=1 Tax=Streptosporangium sp. DT93 TaxID=3393428 RepID=UPI003CF4342C